MSPSLARRALAEGIGTFFLLATVVGSGIMAERLSPDDVGLQLLENGLATAAVLVALILALGPVSGAHLNPAVTIAERILGGSGSTATLVYVIAQGTGGVLGVVTANLMFDLDVVSWSTTGRTGSHLWLAEVVATFGLVLVIFGVVRSGRATAVPVAVGAYIAAAYWFTSSTSFANPAVTVARMFSDTFAGIRPESAPAFVLAELAGLLLAVAAVRVLWPTYQPAPEEVLVPHPVPEDER